MRVADLTIHPDGRIERAGQLLTTMTPVDWDRPTSIPTVAAPTNLPSGVGSQILNLLAERALAAGIRTLRYAGPYPTPALYRALLRSFRTSTPERAFTVGVLDRALRLATDELPFDFTPAPHRRVEFATGWSELRDGVEAASIGGTLYIGESHARLVPTGRGFLRAEIWFGDAPYAHVATIDPDGLPSELHGIPACTSPVLGKAFPPPLRAAIAGLVGDLVPAPLAIDVRRIVAERPIVWADLGARAARGDTAGFSLHAALWDLVAPHGMARVALAVAEALAPVAATRVLAELT